MRFNKKILSIAVALCATLLFLFQNCGGGFEAYPTEGEFFGSSSAVLSQEQNLTHITAATIAISGAVTNQVTVNGLSENIGFCTLARDQGGREDITCTLPKPQAAGDAFLTISLPGFLRTKTLHDNPAVGGDILVQYGTAAFNSEYASKVGDVCTLTFGSVGEYYNQAPAVRIRYFKIGATLNCTLTKLDNSKVSVVGTIDIPVRDFY
jgi:hypothetical protein